MALKNYRVIARKTIYFYVDVIAPSKEQATQAGWETPESNYKPVPDPQHEWKVLDAVIMERDEPVDELKYLSKS